MELPIVQRLFAKVHGNYIRFSQREDKHEKLHRLHTQRSRSLLQD